MEYQINPNPRKRRIMNIPVVVPDIPQDGGYYGDFQGYQLPYPQYYENFDEEYDDQEMEDEKDPELQEEPDQSETITQLSMVNTEEPVAVVPQNEIPAQDVPNTAPSTSSQSTSGASVTSSVSTTGLNPIINISITDLKKSNDSHPTSEMDKKLFTPPVKLPEQLELFFTKETDRIKALDDKLLKQLKELYGEPRYVAAPIPTSTVARMSPALRLILADGMTDLRQITALLLQVIINKSVVELKENNAVSEQTTHLVGLTRHLWRNLDLWTRAGVERHSNLKMVSHPKSKQVPFFPASYKPVRFNPNFVPAPSRGGDTNGGLPIALLPKLTRIPIPTTTTRATTPANKATAPTTTTTIPPTTRIQTEQTSPQTSLNPITKIPFLISSKWTTASVVIRKWLTEGYRLPFVGFFW